jgi:ABC-2 type transport system permease protein
MATRLIGLLIKEMIQFLRDRVILLLILWLYTVEVIVCTLAVSFELENMPLAIADLDRTPASRELIRSFLVMETFAPAGLPAGVNEAAEWLETGRARVALVIPEGFQRGLSRGEPPAVQILIDGTDSNIAAQARMAALSIMGRVGAVAAIEPYPRGGALPVVRIWYNPDGTSTSFMVLSMIALAALMVGVIYPAASIVREKEAGTIEQLRVTPIGTMELFAAKTVPTLVMALLSIFPSLLIVGWFGVPLRGSLLLFLSLSALFQVSAIAIGVLIGSICRTMQQALLLSFFGLFPIMFLSGTITPAESMPKVLQTLSLASPMRHYMDVILGIFLKGAGPDALWPQTMALALIGAPLFLLAAWIFRRPV